MASSEMPTQITALLAPWLDHAGGSMFSTLNELATASHLDSDLWISWRLAETTDGADAWVLTLEAIELLDLYVRVDYRAAWAWILEVLEMPLYVHLLDELPSRIFPKHTISWTGLGPGERGDGSSVARAEQLVFAIPEDLHTARFQDVKDAVMKCWKNEKRGPSERIHICLEVVLEELVENDTDGAERALKELEDLAMLVEDPSRRALVEQLERLSVTTTVTTPDKNQHVATNPTEVFRLEQIEIVTGDSLLTDPIFASLRTIHQRGLRVSSLTMDRGVRVQDLVSLSASVEFLRSVLVPTDSFLHLVSINSSMENTIFQAFCSALSVTQCLRDVRLATPSLPDRYWSWIAYALLSGDVPNQIDSVHLRVNSLTMQDVDQVERVLRATNPIAALGLDLASIDDALKRDREVVDVSPNTVGVLHADSTNQTGAFTVLIDERTCTDLRIVDNQFSQTHVCVSYPGAGLCWVRRDAIVAQRRLPPHRQVSPRHIEFELGHKTSLAALLALARLVGPHTRTLSLFATDSVTLPDEFMRDVLTACPHLERLELTYATLTSFSWLTANDGLRLSSLRIKHVESQDPDGYKSVFTALCDSERGLGRTLRELAIRDYIEEMEPWWPDLVAMLATNRQLERLLLRMRIDDETVDPEPLARQLDAFNGELLQDTPQAKRRVCGVMGLPMPGATASTRTTSA